MVNKIITGKVEKIEIYDSKKSSPKKMRSSKASPVKISSEHCMRGELGENTNLRVRLEDNFENRTNMVVEESVKREDE